MMQRTFRPATATALFGALLLLSACGSQDSKALADAAKTEDGGANEAAPDAAPATSQTTTADAGAQGSTTAAGAATGPKLSAYVGKYPFDAVDGVAFKDHPLVKAGIAATVTNARIRNAITTTQGPSAPIAMVDGKVASWSCQQHNCGEHQWAILIDPATGATDVCYQNDPAMVSETRWFLAGGKEEKRKGDCAIEEPQG